MIRLFASRVYDGRFTKTVKEEFRDIVRAAFKETIRELVNRRLTSALEVTGEKPTDLPQGDEDEKDLITTQEETEGFYIIRSIVRPMVKSDRVVMRDAKSYCAILIDDNNRKPLARLHFNKSQNTLACSRAKEKNECASILWMISINMQTSYSRPLCSTLLQFRSN